MAEEEAPEAVPIPSGNPEAEEQGEEDRRPLPITLITGFLGSGKSTLLKRILQEDHGYRIAVIMNEYGQSVEGSFFMTPEGKKASLGEWVELSNGCMCCAVKSDFVQAIEGLLAKPSDRIDYVLIETTGLANPGPIAAALWVDEGLQSRVQLDGIVTVVDALNVNRELFDPRPDGVVNEAQVQIAYADLILLNKMDLVEEEAVVRAEADIRAINSSVHIYRTHHSNIDVKLVLNRQGYGRNADIALDPIAEDEDECPAPCCSKSQRRHSQTGGVLSHPASRARSMGSMDHDHEGPGGSSRAMHDSRIQTLALRTSQPLDLERFKSFMDTLLWDRNTHPEDIYRVKGLLSISGSGTKHLVQAVYELYEVFATTAWGEAEERASTVVVIGRNLNRSMLEEWFSKTQAA